ncbi:uncharacterized protein ACOB8E_009875 [Sarcophilus harrisii]
MHPPYFNYTVMTKNCLPPWGGVAGCSRECPSCRPSLFTGPGPGQAAAAASSFFSSFSSSSSSSSPLEEERPSPPRSSRGGLPLPGPAFPGAGLTESDRRRSGSQVRGDGGGPAREGRGKEGEGKGVGGGHRTSRAGPGRVGPGGGKGKGERDGTCLGPRLVAPWPPLRSSQALGRRRGAGPEGEQTASSSLAGPAGPESISPPPSPHPRPSHPVQRSSRRRVPELGAEEAPRPGCLVPRRAPASNVAAASASSSRAHARTRVHAPLPPPPLPPLFPPPPFLLPSSPSSPPSTAAVPCSSWKDPDVVGLELLQGTKSTSIKVLEYLRTFFLFMTSLGYKASNGTSGSKDQQTGIWQPVICRTTALSRPPGLKAIIPSFPLQAVQTQIHSVNGTKG